MTTSQHLHAELKRADGLLSHGQAAEAEKILLTLRGQAPRDPYIAYQLGCVWLTQGRATEAFRIWQQTLSLKPGWLHPIVGLANAAHALGQRRECLRFCEMALRLSPNEPQVLINYAVVLSALEQFPPALAAADRALAIMPKSTPVRWVRLDVLSRLRRVDEAEREAEEILRLNPEEVRVCAKLAALRRQRGAFEEALHPEQRMLEAARAGSTGFSEIDLARFTDDPAILAQISRVSLAARIGARTKPPPARTDAGGLLTIGYLSGDLRNHAVGHMLADVLAAHDRGHFRIIAASTGLEDKGEFGTRLRHLADEHIHLGDYEDVDAVQRLRKANIDVLVDLGGSTETGRPGILAGRAAATQVLWLGCPVSTGASWYDAWLVDDYVAPPGYEEHVSEPLLRLPCCYHPITRGADFDPAQALTRTEFGIPDGVPLVAALHLTPKFTSEMVDAWFRITASHPRAVLWLAVGNPRARTSLRERARNHGLDPQRILFADYEPDRARYVSRWGLADLILDSFPYGGHSTMGEALACGSPVITRIGRSLPSRVAGSMLHQLGLDDLIADNLADYESLAMGLLADPQRLAAIRARCALAAERIAADRNRGLTRALEAAYSSLHAQAVARG